MYVSRCPDCKSPIRLSVLSALSSIFLALALSALSCSCPLLQMRPVPPKSKHYGKVREAFDVMRVLFAAGESVPFCTPSSAFFHLWHVRAVTESRSSAVCSCEAIDDCLETDCAAPSVHLFALCMLTLVRSWDGLHFEDALHLPSLFLQLLPRVWASRPSRDAAPFALPGEVAKDNERQAAPPGPLAPVPVRGRSINAEAKDATMPPPETVTAAAPRLFHANLSEVRMARRGCVRLPWLSARARARDVQVILAVRRVMDPEVRWKASRSLDAEGAYLLPCCFDPTCPRHSRGSQGAPCARRSARGGAGTLHAYSRGVPGL